MAPGEQIWKELEPRLATLHAGLEAMVQVQAQLGPEEGGPPLSRIVAYRATEPQPHWHFVTCGLSASRFIEGYPEAGGIELTFRLAREPREETPPEWVVSFLQQLARSAFSEDGAIEAGKSVDLDARLQQVETAVSAGYFVDDPLVARGSIPLMQLVALTDTERGRVEAMSGDRAAELLLELAPAGISDLERERAESPTGAPSPRFETVAVSKSGSRLRLTIGQGEVAVLVDAIAATVRLGKVTCTSPGWTVHLNLEAWPRSASWATTLSVYFTLGLAKQLMAELVARPGEVLRYDALPDLELVVGEAAEAPSLRRKVARFFGAK